MRTILISCLLFLFFFENLAFAGRWRLRAREHFDTVTIHYEDLHQEETTSGIGPTINFWWEEPYENSIGFAVSLMFIDFEVASEELGRGQQMELWERGLEGKHYLIHGAGGIYFRWGISRNQLRTEGSLGELTGTGGYVGIGWEFPFEIFGLAFEIGQRHMRFDENIVIETFSPSIGVHFYEHL